jgi:hypothetical protein
VCPATDMPASARCSQPKLPWTFVRRFQTDAASTLVVVSPPRRFSRPAGRGLIASHYRLGFATFHHPRPTEHRSAGLRPSSRFPRRDSHPSKNSPRRQPYRVTAAVAFLPLPLLRLPPARRSAPWQARRHWATASSPPTEARGCPTSRQPPERDCRVAKRRSRSNR